MKQISKLLLFATLSAPALATETMAIETELSAAHGYVETLDGVVGATGINIPGEDRGDDGRPKMERKLTSWTSANACAVYYFHHPAATVTNTLYLHVKTWRTARFRLTVTDPENTSTPLYTTEFNVTGPLGGSECVMNMGDVTFPRSAYYRYKLECISNNDVVESVNRFKFSTSSDEPSYAANYLSSPSVHLNNWQTTMPGAPTGDGYDWLYEEIMIPAESDIVGTYAEAIGALNGYMGIQMNGYTGDGEPQHDILFSMWDDGSTDEDPNLPEYLRAGAVDHDELTTVNRFGNEGTGVQTYRRGNYWTPGTFVQFITNCRPETTSYTTTENGQTTVHEQHNMLVSTWFNAQDGKGWQYMATVRKRNSSTYFSSWYSFLEDYNWPTGQAQRKAYYRNGYGRARNTGKWYHFNKVGFGHTDGGNETGARSDYGQGATNDAAERTFFMTTGGYTSTKQTSTSVSLASDNTPVDTIDIATLDSRVLQAIEKENRVLLFEQNLFGKDGWQVIDKLSEETVGEDTNGRAQQIIDGDAQTYWHPQWKEATATLPHTLVVDMQKQNNVGGFRINMGTITDRFIKAYDIYGSADNDQWTLLCSDDDVVTNGEILVLFDKAVDIRYFKIVIRQTTAAPEPWVRIYEVDVTSGKAIPVVDAVEAVNVRQTGNDGIRYNLNGQRVGNDYHGIVVVNGKKYIAK